MPRQYSLRFPDQPERFADLAITDSNRGAIETIRNWPAWSQSALCLVGPVQSGLRVMARLWADEAEAVLMDAVAFNELSETDIDAKAKGRWAIDLADEVTNEDNLLTLLNLARQREMQLLLTARSAPAQWGGRSPDLQSRLIGMPHAEIYPPDEDMLVERLQAACRRRYMRIDEKTIAFLAIRLPRSYAAIEEYVSRLDEAVDANQRAPSIHLARTVLEDGAGSRALFGEADDL